MLQHFHPVLPASALRGAPVQVTVDGVDYALFRDAGGRPAALLDACPHRKAPLSAGRVRPDGRLACPYHGWHFDAEGHGVAPAQPTLKKCDTHAFQVLERHGYLWLANRDVPAAHMPEIGWPGYESIGTFAMDFDAPLHVCLDNFSEDEHTPYVHTRLGWTEDATSSIEFSADNFEDRTEVHYKASQRSTLARRLVGIRDGDLFHNDWITRFDPVRTLYDVSWSDAKTGELRPVKIRAVIFKVPLDERRTRFHVFGHASIDDRVLRWLSPVLKPAALALIWKEIWDDARFIPTVAGTPFSFEGMRLDKFDKPLIHNHKLLQSIYWGEPREPVLTREALATARSGPTPSVTAGRLPIVDDVVHTIATGMNVAAKRARERRANGGAG